MAQIIVAAMRAAGVKRVYGVASDSLRGLLEAIAAYDDLTFVAVRHEESAAFAAGAEANLTSGLAVCMGASGSGSMRLLNGLYDCHRSHLPVLAIMAQVPSAEIGSEYYREVHTRQLFRECSHYCESVSVPEQAVRLCESAIQAALSLGGVGVLVVPSDVALLEADAPEPLILALGHRSAVVPASDKVAAAADLLNDCEKVTILAGTGIEGAHAELLQAAQTLQAPVVHTLRGKECVEPNNPFDVGLTGLLGMPAGYYALLGADGVLMLGTDFPYRQYFPPQARVVQVDKRPEHLGRRTRVEVGLHGTVAETLHKLLPLLRARANPGFLQAAQQRALDQQLLAELAEKPGDSAVLRPQRVAYLLNELSADDTIFTCDAGTPLIWAGRYLRMNGRRRLINSFVHGSLAAAMPQAIGAALAKPGHPVIALCGEVGVSMLLGELLTVRQLAVPIKLIILNDGGLRLAEMKAVAAGAKSLPGAQLPSPDFALLAEAAGIRGLRVSEPAQLEAVLREALAHDGPVVVDAIVSSEESQLLPDPNQAPGLTAQAMKDLVYERSGELLGLATPPSPKPEGQDH